MWPIHLHDGLAIDDDVAVAYSRCLLHDLVAMADSQGLYLNLHHDLAINHGITKDAL